MIIIKRDGTPQEYNFIKIIDAVTKAFGSVDQVVPDKFLSQLKESVEKVIIKNNGNGTNIEEIQDVIQKELIKRNHYEVVESFITYRKKREEEREKNSDLIKQIQDKLFAKNVQNQNANLDEKSFGGRVGEAASIVCKNEALKLVSKTTRRNHEKNMVYIHDLDAYADGRHNCLTYPEDKSLEEGVLTRQTDVRKAGSVNTAMQLTAVYFQLQSLQQFGGVSASHLDWSMVPYIRKSYEKHYLLEYIKTLDEFNELDILGMSHQELNHWVENKVTEFFLSTQLEDKDFYFANMTNLDHKLRQRALLETKKETYQAVEGMYHNLNTLQSRSGNQLPFSSINYGTCTEPEGRMLIKALLEVSMEGLGKQGVTSIFPCGIFQIKKGINFYKEDPNYDLKRLALKSTSMRIYPNYANCDWSNQVAWLKQDRNMKQEFIDSLPKDQYNLLVERLEDHDEEGSKLLGLELYENYIKVDEKERPFEMFSTMGCRTINGLDINALDNFKNNVYHFINLEFDQIDDVFSGVQKDGRGNICPVTIILPTLALMAKQKIEKKTEKIADDEIFDEFIKILDKKIFEAKDTLLERFNHIASQSWESGKFMYQNHTMSGYHEDEGIISALKHGTIVIGQLGLAEALQIMFKFDHTDAKGMEYAKKIEQLFLDRTSEFKKEYKLNFGVYYTPAENLCFTAMKNFKRLNPGFEQENVTYIVDKQGNKHEKLYFTNSIHVPVWYDCDLFKKIDIESQLTGYSNAGCITYVELPSKCTDNIDALEEALDYAMEHDIPYFAINIPLNRCEKCGEPIHDEDAKCCPKCGHDKIVRLGRITGYLSTTVEHFNLGKQNEFNDRIDHVGQSIIKSDC